MSTNDRVNNNRLYWFSLQVILAAIIFLLTADLLFAQDLQELTKQAAAVQSGSSGQVNTPAQKVKLVEDVFQFNETPKLRGYTYDLKSLLAVAQRNIKKVDAEIMLGEIFKRNEARGAQIISHFEKGNQLYRQGKLKEAKQEWENALKASQDPEMKQYIEDSSRQVKLQIRKEESVRKLRLEVEERELCRLAKIQAQEDKEWMIRQGHIRKLRLEAEERELCRLEDEWQVND